MVYKLWDQGKGPKYKEVGGRRIITGEAAAEWRRQGLVTATPKVA